MLAAFCLPAQAAPEGDWEQALFGPYARLLDRYLEERTTDNGGLVSAFHYRRALVASDTGELVAQQRRILTHTDPDNLESKSEAIAFWINAYNFFMLAHILENPSPNGHPVKSVNSFGGLLNPFRVFELAIFDVGGKLYSLDNVEKDILLGEEYEARGWKEARVHFAVNCASVGCPPLRKEIYHPESVDTILTENTRAALRTRRHLSIRGGTLHLTPLFDWYREDFIDEAGSIRIFIRRYTDRALRERIAGTDDIEYIDYGWALNSPENFPEFQ